MPQTRKRKNSGKASSQELQEVAREEVNRDKEKCTTKIAKPKNGNKGKQSQVEPMAKQSKVNNSDVTKMQFTDGNDTVQMLVEGDITSEDDWDDDSIAESNNSNNEQNVRSDGEVETSDIEDPPDYDQNTNQSDRSRSRGDTHQSKSRSRSRSSHASESDLSQSESDDEYKINKRRKKAKKRRKRQSVEDRLDGLTNALFAMKDLITKQKPTLHETEEQDMNNRTVKSKVIKVRPGSKDKSGKKIVNDEIEMTDNQSVTTVYQDAVEKFKESIENTDSEIEFNTNQPKDNSLVDNDETVEENNKIDERVDTSNEMLVMDDADKFIAECVKQAREHVTPTKVDHGEKIIREAEAERVRLFPTPSNNLISLMQQGLGEHAARSSLIDENYMCIGGHVDMTL